MEGWMEDTKVIGDDGNEALFANAWVGCLVEAWVEGKACN